MAYAPLSDELAQEAIDAYERNGNNVQFAANELGLPRNTLSNRILRARQRGIGTVTERLETLHGHNPAHDLTHVVPSPLVLRGTSTMYNKDGGIQIQWVKTKLDDKLVEAALRAAVEALAEDIPKAKRSTPPTHTVDNLCNLYTLTDCHVGMKAWAPETGADWDLDIAESTLTGAIDYLVDACPPAKVGIINNLGDFLHYDSLSAVTPQHGHLLDADSRFSKMVKVATRILRYCIDRALQRHEQVIVLMAEGNHDMASSVWLRHLFSLLYENEPRVSVLESEMPYYVYPHGDTMLAFHHGHLKKNDQLPILFAAQYPKEWGNATKRYCHTGHRHHVEEKEHSGMIVTQHATIAARDAYASRGGWVADRQMTAITYHKQYGKAATITVTPEMLQ